MTPQEKKELLEVAEKTFLAGANLIFCSIPNLGCSVMENLRYIFDQIFFNLLNTEAVKLDFKLHIRSIT